MAVDMTLAENGQRLPIIGLVQQGRVSQKLAEHYAPELQAVGFTPEETAEIGVRVAELDTQKARSAELHDTSKIHTGIEKAALADGKAFKRKLDLKLRRYFRSAGLKPVTKDAFEAGGTIGRSTPKMSQYLANIRGSLVLIDDRLKPMNGGMSVVAELDQVKARLDGAQTTQEFGKLGLPEETLKVYEAKGRLYQLIQELCDAGRDAFDGQAEIAAKFNKDLLLAAVRPREVVKAPLASAG